MGPRSLNDKADYLSKIIDYDDWELAPEFFQQLDGLWGPYTVDCFPLTTTKKFQNIFQDSGTLRRQVWIRFSRTSEAKIVYLYHRFQFCLKFSFSCLDLVPVEG